MIIPKLHYISQGSTPKEHIEHIQKACSSGIELVQLKLNDISEKKFLKFAKEAREITAHFQTRLIINDNYKIAHTVKADGVHLEKPDSFPITARKYLYTWQSIGGTANTIEDCKDLLKKQVDYISLGVFRSTSTKDNLPVIGIDGYKTITAALKTETPIIGVGGITTDDVKNILEVGISGVAVSNAITQNFNNIKIFNQLLNASATAEQRYTFAK